MSNSVTTGLTGKLNIKQMENSGALGNLLFSASGVAVTGLAIVGNLVISEKFIEPLVGNTMAWCLTIFFSSAGELILTRLMLDNEWRKRQHRFVLLGVSIVIAIMYLYDLISNIYVLMGRAAVAHYTGTLAGIAVLALSLLMCLSEWFFTLALMVLGHDWHVWVNRRNEQKPIQKSGIADFIAATPSSLSQPEPEHRQPKKAAADPFRPAKQ